jgi:imidazolonepropionase-like amidohydrolase
VKCTAWRLAVIETAALVLLRGAAPREIVRQRTDVFIRSERWLDPISGEMKGPVVIQVSGDRMAKVVSAAGANAPPTTLDLGKATILPGLVDAHVHLQIGGAPNENARKILRAGFTTVVDLGSTSDAVLRVRDRVSRGEEEGPRILAAGNWVGTKGGICEFGGIGVPGGPDAFRARVRENIAAGADLSKVQAIPRAAGSRVSLGVRRSGARLFGQGSVFSSLRKLSGHFG